MAMSDHPAWRDYKAALAQLADASTQVEEARTLGSPHLEEVEREFQTALRAYEAAQERLRKPG